MVPRQAAAPQRQAKISSTFGGSSARARSGSRRSAPRPAAMVRIASMNTRRFSITDSQFGSQPWLMKRASLPSTPASMTVLRSTMNRNVWLSFVVLDRRSGGPPRACETRSPRYSMMRVPLRMRRSANTPRPCTLRAAHLDERRRPCGALAATSDRHRRCESLVMLVVHELEVLVLVVEHARPGGAGCAAAAAGTACATSCRSACAR